MIGINFALALANFSSSPFRKAPVKIRARKNFSDRNLRRSAITKRKSPARPGFLTNFFFRSAHFASLAI
jgi:hypothetical protein